MPAEPLFSVVITTFKRPQWLTEALTSVARQTYDRYEVLVVNNDLETAETVDRAVQAFGFPLRVLHNDRDIGQSASRNRGVQAAAGEIIGILDDDDIWHPQFLEHHARAHTEHDHAGVVYCGHHVVWDGVPLARRTHFAPPPPPDTFNEMLRGEFTLATNSILSIKRSALVEVGGYDPNLAGFPDWDLLCRLAEITSFVHIPQPLVDFRMHLAARESDPAQRLMELDKVRAKWSDHPEIALMVRRFRSEAYYNASRLSALGGAREAGARYLRRYISTYRHGHVELANLIRLLIVNGLGPDWYTRLQRWLPRVQIAARGQTLRRSSSAVDPGRRRLPPKSIGKEPGAEPSEANVS